MRCASAPAWSQAITLLEGAYNPLLRGTECTHSGEMSESTTLDKVGSEGELQQVDYEGGLQLGCGLVGGACQGGSAAGGRLGAAGLAGGWLGCLQVGFVWVDEVLWGDI